MGILYKKTGSFLTIFRRKGGGVWPNPKNPYQKKLRWSEKEEGGGRSQFFWLKVKKNNFFMAPLSSSDHYKFVEIMVWQKLLGELMYKSFVLRRATFHPPKMIEHFTEIRLEIIISKVVKSKDWSKIEEKKVSHQTLAQLK